MPLSLPSGTMALLGSARPPADAMRVRGRVRAPLLRDEDIDLTINELMRIRGRSEKTQESE